MVDRFKKHMTCFYFFSLFLYPTTENCSSQLIPGTLDTTFKAGETPGYSIDQNSLKYDGTTIQADGKIIVVGRSEGPLKGYIARYFGSFASTPEGFIQYYPTTSFGFLGGGI